jgi:hypothetical protein
MRGVAVQDVKLSLALISTVIWRSGCTRCKIVPGLNQYSNMAEWLYEIWLSLSTSPLDGSMQSGSRPGRSTPISDCTLPIRFVDISIPEALWTLYISVNCKVVVWNLRFWRRCLWRMPSSGKLRRIAFARTEVSEASIVSIFKVKTIGEPGITLAITSNRNNLLRNFGC